ncbi:permease prefix domain 1-containing protein [Clostridium sp. SHJSY1]|uniref:permease prefix domain 1-containing protein n=1 Tax=Clostridium sp. SHJSY1 TaxID=2942483 RepID=UPI0028765645|nr:permease prefix domain 1-containing protein [Clostridium sp. SHJSY1]MDS0528427.1 permease prefix domain 1-containing protein [Clostridium sp. SHJSY1]
MYERFRQKLDELFENAPETHRARELKEELLANLMDKYNDLISNGKAEEDAFNIAVSSIGDVDELINGLKEKDEFNYEEMKRRSKKSAFIISISIGIYIMSVVVMIMLSEVLMVDENIAACIMLTMDAVATCLIIYNSVSRPKYLKADSTIVEEFKEWKSETSREREVIKSINSIVWLIIVALYFVLSFIFGTWYFSWLIFIIGIAITKIIKLSFQLRK